MDENNILFRTQMIIAVPISLGSFSDMTLTGITRVVCLVTENK